jgi:Ni/Co efflux regulator RcnB
MKKLLFLLIIALSVSSISFAQDDQKDKTKKTSTVPQKVHNTFSKNKKYNGHKSKHERNGHSIKHKHTAKKTTTKVD